MDFLEQTEVCQTCGRPYLIRDGHDCPGPRRARFHRLAALPLACAVLAALAAGCTPAPPPAHFGNCPPGQHWTDPSGGPYGWECAR